jgi:hypothetical protein
MDEMGDLTAYILNKKATLSIAIKNVPKVTIKNLLVRLKRQGIYSTKEWAESKKNKKIILQVVDQLSQDKRKLT